MWTAFAIWDGRSERLFLARDRFGEKPLFLYEDAHGLYFASEIKALLRLPGMRAGVDFKSVWDYLAYRYVPGPRTLFTGIRKLMPGTTALWERAGAIPSPTDTLEELQRLVRTHGDGFLVAFGDPG